MAGEAGAKEAKGRANGTFGDVWRNGGEQGRRQSSRDRDNAGRRSPRVPNAEVEGRRSTLTELDLEATRRRAAVTDLAVQEQQRARSVEDLKLQMADHGQGPRWVRGFAMQPPGGVAKVMLGVGMGMGVGAMVSQFLVYSPGKLEILPGCCVGFLGSFRVFFVQQKWSGLFPDIPMSPWEIFRGWVG